MTQNSLTNPREGCAAPITGAPELQEHPGHQGGTAELPHGDCQRRLNLLKEWSGWQRRGEGHWGNGQRWEKGEEWRECPTVLQHKYPRNCLQLLNQQEQNRMNGVLIFNGDGEQGTRLGGLRTWRSTHQNPLAYWWAPAFKGHRMALCPGFPQYRQRPRASRSCFPWLWGIDVPPAWAPCQVQRVRR